MILGTEAETKPLDMVETLRKKMKNLALAEAILSPEWGLEFRGIGGGLHQRLVALVARAERTELEQGPNAAYPWAKPHLTPPRDKGAAMTRWNWTAITTAGFTAIGLSIGCSDDPVDPATAAKQTSEEICETMADNLADNLKEEDPKLEKCIARMDAYRETLGDEFGDLAADQH